MEFQPGNIDVSTIDGTTELEMHVRCRLSGRVRQLELQILDAGVTLRGRATTYHAKQLAQHAVMEMTDLPILANEIEVC